MGTRRAAAQSAYRVDDPRRSPSRGVGAIIAVPAYQPEFMQLFAFGINHETAPLSLREQVVFSAENLVQALRDFVDRNTVKEAAIISTCNRTEIYCDAE